MKEERAMRVILGLAIAMLVISIVSIRPVSAVEEKKALKDVPKACVDAVKKRFANGELTGEASKEETEDGKTVYEISVKQAGKKIDVTLTPEGEIAMIEAVIDAKDLPKEVSGGVEKKYPKAKYELAESVTTVDKGKEKLSYYEVLVSTADGKKMEIEVALDGAIKKEEDKTKGDEEKDEKKEPKAKKDK
jgi:hypothetical protein